MTTNTPSAAPLLSIIPSYAAVLALIFIYLSWRVIQQRRKCRVAIGDGDNAMLKRAIAVHSNFAQYVPLALLLLTFLALNHANPIVLHALCLTLLVARVTHAYGVSQANENFKLRQAGTIMTFGVLIMSSFFIFMQVI